AVRAAARRWGRQRGRTISCCRDRFGSLLFRPCYARVIECQLLTGARGMIAPGVMPEPRVADLVQPFRQHVLQEAAHELMAVEARCVPASRCAMLVANVDTVVIESHQPGPVHGLFYGLGRRSW